MEWISVKDRVPDRFEGLKLFKVKMMVGPIAPKEREAVIFGRWYPSGSLISSSLPQKGQGFSSFIIISVKTPRSNQRFETWPAAKDKNPNIA